MVSQALASCAHTVAPGSVPDSIHANLLGGGSSGEPIEFRVDRVRDGAALQHRDVRGYQAGSSSCTPQSSRRSRSGADWQAGASPPAATPRGSRPNAMACQPRMGGLRGRCTLRATRRVSTPGIRSGMRSVTEIPEDPWLHGAVVAFWSDYGMNGASGPPTRMCGAAFQCQCHPLGLDTPPLPAPGLASPRRVDGFPVGKPGIRSGLAPRLLGSTRRIDISGGVHKEAATVAVKCTSHSAVAADHLRGVSLQRLYPGGPLVTGMCTRTCVTPAPIHLSEPFQVRLEVDPPPQRLRRRTSQLLDLDRDRGRVTSCLWNPASMSTMASAKLAVSGRGRYGWFGRRRRW